MQTYAYRTDFGGGVVLAPCDQVFVGEMARCNASGLLPDLTNLGMPGDLRHQLEGSGSDHNPFVTGPSGLRYVRAFDLGGPRASWNLVIEFWNWRYAERDPRVYPYGYTNSDQPPPHGLTIWFGGGATRQGTDGSHGHYSLSRANTNTVGRAAWIPALDDRSPWGLEAWLRARLGQPTVTAPPVDQEDHAMQFPFKAGPGSQYPGAVFVAANRVVTWVPGSTNDDVWKGVLDSIGLVNGLETNGRVTQPLNYQTAKPITRYEDLPVVDEIAALGVLVGPTPNG